ncbi:MAG: (2Fe-2S) ferredoxin domain-containing protein [Planctomycetota bacterium]|nr:(2Fe-2S) ferredoxin domain-containing protein [Planctomycetota bacterium]MDA1114536.1 (2Fe-2S) ferredoxin domain-containing protein [Planctomycetota bacterium]
MARPEKLIFICVNERAPGHKESCGAAHDSAAIGQAFKKCLKQRGLNHSIRATTTSCLGPCTGGPHAVVMPDNVWYSGFSVDDVEEILESHLVNGKSVERLLAPNPDSTHG